MNYFALIFFFTFSFIIFQRENYRFKLVASIPFESSKLWEVDLTGNIYVWDKNQIILYNSEGKLIRTFSRIDKILVTYIDVQNPLRILLFSKDFQTIIFLDKTLSLKGDEISLTNLGYDNVSLACASSNNGFWIFDKTNNELVKFDSELNVVNRSNNLSVTLNKTLDPIFLCEQNNFVYLYDNERGLLVFDIYATYHKTIPLKCSDFQLIGEFVFYYDQKVLKKYNHLTFEETRIELPDTNVFKIRINQQKLYIQRIDRIDVYSF